MLIHAKYVLVCLNQQEEVVKKTESFEQLKEEAHKCLVQSEKLSTEKDEFESEVYAKVLCSLSFCYQKYISSAFTSILNQMK